MHAKRGANWCLPDVAELQPSLAFAMLAGTEGTWSPATSEGSQGRHPWHMGGSPRLVVSQCLFIGCKHVLQNLYIHSFREASNASSREWEMGEVALAQWVNCIPNCTN